MRIPFLTYCPLVAPRYFPYVSVRSAGPGSPHTSGVRYCPCGPIATKPHRPTACTEHSTPPPFTSTANSKLLTPNWIYTFSAKERDSETGLSYFGSRYYSSDLSIWLSVDPQAAKYAHQSNYVYCSNNPLRMIDPNGEEEWDLEKDGTLSQRANGRTDIDIVHAKDKDGNDVERYYKAGSINFNAQCDERYNKKVGWFTTDIMEFANSETAMDFFEFAANYSDVEWGLLISPEKSIVGTSHDDGFVSLKPIEGMTYDIHSHIDNPLKEMTEDHLQAMEAYDKGVTFKVYEAYKRSYATYNPDSHKLDGPREMSLILEKTIQFLRTLSR